MLSSTWLGKQNLKIDLTQSLKQSNKHKTETKLNDVSSPATNSSYTLFVCCWSVRQKQLRLSFNQSDGSGLNCREWNLSRPQFYYINIFGLTDIWSSRCKIQQPTEDLTHISPNFVFFFSLKKKRFRLWWFLVQITIGEKIEILIRVC